MEARNFQSVVAVLRCLGKLVRVVDVQCKSDFWGGLWLGVWSMGSARGCVLGTLVWSRSEQHVFVVECEGMECLLGACESSSAPGSPP